LKRQLEVLDPALIVTLGRHSMGRFMPGARISQAHGTVRPIDPETGAADAMVLAMYHPAAALRSTEVERQSYADAGLVPGALEDARRRRAGRRSSPPGSGSDTAAGSPPLPRDTATVAGPAESAVPLATLTPDGASPPEPQPVEAAIAVASAVGGAEYGLGNRPRDIEPARGEVSDPSSLTIDSPATDPSDQLPLF
jgi:hypothetical protein